LTIEIELIFFVDHIGSLKLKIALPENVEWSIGEFLEVIRILKNLEASAEAFPLQKM